MQVKLIIFDLDGTLVDSIADITQAVNYTMACFDLPGLTVEEVKQHVGEGVGNLLSKASGGRLVDRQGDMTELFVNYYLQHVMDYTRPYDKVIQTLETLSGYKKAVVSNKTEALSRELLCGLAMAQYFDLVTGSDTFTQRKPSPLPVLKTMDMLGASPQETLMVGDSSYDIEAGKGAGATTVAVAYGYRPIETLTEADFIINNDIGELLPIIRQLAQ
ncbi:phosphoglycolate phosphatase, bacterial [Candidatus Magnetobacterium bavaricum]|uniref:phosphoglycolate phosphatase n=1 Tax=Candidatus Magnetobacterium bavaricum TaxID=29290 RepID=A0A0F3GM73_9BACT|nr:phosphoglycolate phosphatase, bacterial [Candidatus Magnetobacterium bavaricum]